MIFFIGWIISLIVICWLYYYPKKKVEKEHHVKESEVIVPEVLEEPEQSSFDFSDDDIDSEFAESVRKAKVESEIKKHYRSIGLNLDKMDSLGVEGSFGPQGMKGPIGIPYSAKRNPILPIDSRIILKDTLLIDSTFYVGMPVMVNGKHVILKNKNC
jgi:hypothetical protein